MNSTIHISSVFAGECSMSEFSILLFYQIFKQFQYNYYRVRPTLNGSVNSVLAMPRSYETNKKWLVNGLMFLFIHFLYGMFGVWCSVFSMWQQEIYLNLRVGLYLRWAGFFSLENPPAVTTVCSIRKGHSVRENIFGMGKDNSKNDILWSNTNPHVITIRIETGEKKKKKI